MNLYKQLPVLYYLRCRVSSSGSPHVFPNPLTNTNIMTDLPNNTPGTFRPALLVSALVALSLFFSSCSRTMNPDIERGSNYKFKEGYPEVRLSAIGLLNEKEEPYINVAADIVYGSLIYKEKKGRYTANISAEIRILNKENPEEVIKTKQTSFTIENRNSNIVNSQELFTFQEQVPVDPGEYRVSVVVTDRHSGKQITRTTQTFIPDPSENVSNLTNIRMLGKDNEGSIGGQWKPITTYDIPGRMDSLRFIFQVTNNRSEAPLTIDSKLIRYKSDTSIARSMYYTNYTQGDMAYKGVEYDDAEIIQSSRRELQQPGSVLIEFTFPQQKRGNYRFEVNTNESGDQSSMFKARDFSIKSKNYPSIKSPRELARPLYYLMDEGEWEEMVSIKDPDSLKRAVDRFWLKNIQSESKAKNVIKMYYERVEEANKQFSNFKEGWKTDMGMIYILFGPPWYVRERLDQMRWSYAYNTGDPEYNFLFRQTRMKTEHYPFDNYLLQRRQFYFTVEHQQKELWLSGRILSRSI